MSQPYLSGNVQVLERGRGGGLSTWESQAPESMSGRMGPSAPATVFRWVGDGEGGAGEDSTCTKPGWPPVLSQQDLDPLVSPPGPIRATLGFKV